MIDPYEIFETINMISNENLDIRTITLGISLRDCSHPDIDALCTRVYDKITGVARNLVKTGEAIEREYGIPIINKRIAVTPIAIVAERWIERPGSLGLTSLEDTARWCTKATPSATSGL